MITVRVPLGDRSYDVLVGHGARRELAALLPRSARRAAVVTQAGIPLDVDPGIPFQRFEIGEGEQHKTLATVESLCRGFAGMGLTRNDVVIGVGGGMVTDVAGFAAASWHRGISVVHVSTTLLGMVDAAIGGKTGVNLPAVDGVGGKNLVGAYWQPSGVVCDLDALATLPPRELRCGRGEMAKYHFLTGDDLLAMGEAERIARCVQIKAEVVAGDEREGGRRALLNYGHTLAHALEIETDYQLLHGEAVGVGLIYAAHLAHHLGRIDSARVQQHYDVVGGAYELGTALPVGLAPERLVALMGLDKKVLGDLLTFVLDGPAGVEVVPGVAASDALAALQLMP
ncbi:MAG: 3-dehydroquinate synthase family protein [Actinomycetota bacterium]|nr:3-dehydroquinate synthase family protein [Actinomycetota bacterium]